LVRTAVPVQQFIDDAIHSVHAAADAKHVTLKQELAPAQVEVHRESMIQLMDILLDNALKYGGGNQEVLIKGEVRSGYYLLSVKDHGPGLAADDIPHIFNRLYRGDKARSTKISGYGLGLALAKEIAEANDAVITARNNTDGGACFELQLELAEERA